MLFIMKYLPCWGERVKIIYAIILMQQHWLFFKLDPIPYPSIDLNLLKSPLRHLVTPLSSPGKKERFRNLADNTWYIYS